jgi:hypothetical protein
MDSMHPLKRLHRRAVVKRRAVAVAMSILLVMAASLPAIAAACEGGGGEEHNFDTIVLSPSPVVFTKAGREKVTIKNGNVAFWFEIKDVYTSGLPFKALGDCIGIILTAGNSCLEEVEYSGTFKKGEKGSVKVETFLDLEKDELKS